MRKFFTLCTLVLLSAGIAYSQDGAAMKKQAPDATKRPSPAAHAEFQFNDGKTVVVDYSSPRTKGRKIYGGLVPYGQVWRAGANEATTIAIDTDVMIGGKAPPAGTSTIFTIP